jgi:hypothetical protein
MMSPIGDELMATRLGMVGLGSFIKIVVTPYPDRPAVILLVVVPPLAITLPIVRLVVQVKRPSLRHLLFQIEVDEVPIMSKSLEFALSSVVSENPSRLIVHEVLLCSSNIVTSPNFIRSCLGRFPNNELFLRCVTFPFAAFWESNSDVHCVFLLLLNINSFEMTRK